MLFRGYAEWLFTPLGDLHFAVITYSGRTALEETGEETAHGERMLAPAAPAG